MKLITIFLFFALLPTFLINAQVGIGTTTPNATLDIKSSNEVTPANTDGILIPKIEEYPTTNPTASQDGMMVFVTGNGSITKGFYYWDNTTTSWTILSGSGAEKINDLLDGKSDNDGTNNGSSIFLGIDAGLNDDGTNNVNVGVGYKALYSNTIGFLNTANGYEALYSNTTGVGNTANGAHALYSNTIGGNNTANGFEALYRNTTGSRNIANGNEALFSNTTGSRNIANGFEALRDNSTGTSNTANGYQALYLNTTGDNNTATGYETLYINSTGKSNTALGFQALRVNTDGDYNIGIGNKAGYYAKGDRNIFIGNEGGEGTVNYNIDRSIFLGNQAGRYETNSDRLYIENSQSTTPLIYGEFDTNLLRINGELQVGDPSTTGYKLPSTDGAANQVLQTNGSGVIDWANSISISSGLEKITENGQTGWRLVGRNPSNYGDIGIGAIDLSYNDGSSTTRGATGEFSLATGKRTTALGIFSTALGGLTTATGNYAIAMGNNSRAESYGQTSVGVYNTIVAGTPNSFVATDRIFVIGNGVNNANKSDALTILKNGTITAPSFDISEITDNKALVTKEYVDTNFGSGIGKIDDLLDGKSDNDGTENGSSIFLGIDAGLNDDGTDNKNIGVGYQALYSNTTGSGNTANGYQAFYRNTTGYNNIANGYQALYSNTIGNLNTANGYQALYSNTTGGVNTANGAGALHSNTTGIKNTANGASSLFFNTTGESNTANGAFSLYSNTTGIGNTANGHDAIFSNTTGANNTANGYGALFNNTTGDNNVAIGHSSLLSNTLKDNNTAIGGNSDVVAGSSNATALGYLAVAGTSNQVRIGNSSVSLIGGYADWFNFSDKRIKTNIKEDIKGLEFIKKLRPVSYNYNMDAIARFEKTPDSLRLKDAELLKAKEIQTGFIAQEVETAAKEVGFNFHGVVKPYTSDALYAIRYAEFVVPLVKAVQEQQSQIEALKKEIQKIKALLLNK